MKAYTYTAKHIKSGLIYYGVRKSEVFDLGTEYFTSSKIIKRLIIEEGLDSFVFRLRRKFDSYEQARFHESKLLQRIKVVSNPKFFNQAVSAPRLPSKDFLSEESRKKAISIKLKELWKDEDYRNNQTFNKISREERSKRGKKGSKKRAENYSSGKTIRKPKSKPNYKEVVLIREDERKIVKSNQVPAYRKLGWEKL
jgi:hypothetical protein